MALTAGDKLGPYEILGIIGAGGMGEVYRARDSRLNREVAVKISAAQFTERFDREARAVAALNHPNICQLYDVGPNYLVMELVEGEAPQGPLPLEEALAIARQIAAALEEAHEKGITHRDLKPANIKVKPDGTVKVLDFGLAKVDAVGAPASENSPTITMAATQAGIILGTAAYMSPEQARGKAVDKRADIWSFGVVLYELLTGKKSFEGEDVSHTLAAVILKEPNLDEAPAQVRRLLRSCLAKDPRRRLRDIGDVWQLLEDPASAAEPPRPAITEKSRLNSPLWWAISALLAALAALLAWTWKPTPPSAITKFSVTLPENQQLNTATNRLLLSISPDGQNLVYNANQRLFLRSIRDMEPREILGTYFDAKTSASPVFSPDGQEVAFYNTDQTIKRIPVTGGAAVTVCQSDGAPLGIDWAQDGIVFSRGRFISRVSATGGTPETLVNAEEGETFAAPQMLPGGKQVLFTLAEATAITLSNWNNAKVVVQDLKTGHRKTVIEAGAYGRYLPTGHIVYALGGTLYAVPFNLKRLERSAGPTAVVEGVARSPGTGFPHFGVSTNGTLVYLPGPATSGSLNDSDVLALADMKGKTEPLKKMPRAP